MNDWYRNPTFDAAAKIEQRRHGLVIEAQECKYRQEPIFRGDSERCNRRNQDLDRCNYCNVKRGQNG